MVLNHKKLLRIYRKEELTVRRRRSQKRTVETRAVGSAARIEPTLELLLRHQLATTAGGSASWLVINDRTTLPGDCRQYVAVGHLFRVRSRMLDRECGKNFL